MEVAADSEIYFYSSFEAATIWLQCQRVCNEAAELQNGCYLAIAARRVEVH